MGIEMKKVKKSNAKKNSKKKEKSLRSVIESLIDSKFKFSAKDYLEIGIAVVNRGIK